MLNTKLKKLILAMSLVSSTTVFATDTNVDGITGSLTIKLGGENTLMYKNVYNALKSESVTAALLIRYPDHPSYTTGGTFRLINANVTAGEISFPLQGGLLPTKDELKYELIVEVYGQAINIEGNEKHNILFATEVHEFTIAENLTTHVEGTLWLNKQQNVVMKMNDTYIEPGTHTMTYHDGQTTPVTVNGVTGDTSFLANFNVTNPPVYLTNAGGSTVTLDYSYASAGSLPMRDVGIILGEGDINFGINFNDGEFIRSEQGLTLSPLPDLSSEVTLSIEEDKVPVGDYEFEVTINGQPDTSMSISVNYVNHEGSQTETGFAGQSTYSFTHDTESTVDLIINLDLTILSQSDVVNVKLVEKKFRWILI